MKVASLHCAPGISGDRTLAALIDAGARTSSGFRPPLTPLGLPGVELRVETIVKGACPAGDRDPS